MDNEINELEKPFAPDSALDLTLSSVSKLFTTFSTDKYLEDNLQHSLKIILEAKTSVTCVIFLNKPYKKLLMIRFLDIDYGKTHMKCYNFCH